MKKYIFCFLILVITPLLYSQSDDVLFFQAELFDKNVQPIDGTDYTVDFSIWSSATGGTDALWSQTISNITIQRGSISVLLGGSAAPFPNDLFTGSEDRYIEITVTKDTVSETLSPRMKITSSLYTIGDKGGSSSECPSGMVKVSTYCIDIQRNPVRTYYAAFYNCQNRGLRICDWMDIMHACESGLLDINNGTTIAEEWTTDALESKRQSTWGVPGDEGAWGGEYCYQLGGTPVVWSGAWEMKYYRCCK